MKVFNKIYTIMYHTCKFLIIQKSCNLITWTFQDLHSHWQQDNTKKYPIHQALEKKSPVNSHPITAVLRNRYHLIQENLGLSDVCLVHWIPSIGGAPILVMEGCLQKIHSSTLHIKVEWVNEILFFKKLNIYQVIFPFIYIFWKITLSNQNNIIFP